MTTEAIAGATPKTVRLVQGIDSMRNPDGNPWGMNVSEGAGSQFPVFANLQYADKQANCTPEVAVSNAKSIQQMLDSGEIVQLTGNAWCGPLRSPTIDIPNGPSEIVADQLLNSGIRGNGNTLINPFSDQPAITVAGRSAAFEPTYCSKFVLLDLGICSAGKGIVATGVGSEFRADRIRMRCVDTALELDQTHGLMLGEIDVRYSKGLAAKITGSNYVQIDLIARSNAAGVSAENCTGLGGKWDIENNRDYNCSFARIRDSRIHGHAELGRNRIFLSRNNDLFGNGMNWEYDEYSFAFAYGKRVSMLTAGYPYVGSMVYSNRLALAEPGRAIFSRSLDGNWCQMEWARKPGYFEATLAVRGKGKIVLNDDGLTCDVQDYDANNLMVFKVGGECKKSCRIMAHPESAGQVRLLSFDQLLAY